MPLATAERLWGTAGEVNLISVVLNDNADEKAVMESLTAVLPKGLNVRSPMERSDLSKELIEKVQRGLDVAYGTIIALAFVTILNTFLMNVGERRRQLAVLRAIGTTRRQLIQMLLVEGLVMGFVGTLLGTAAGLGGAYLLTQSIAKVYATTMPALQITPVPFIVAGCLGPSRFAVGDVHPGLDCRPDFADRGHEIRRLPAARPPSALVRFDRGSRLRSIGAAHGRVHRRLSAGEVDDDRRRALHGGVPAVDSDRPSPAGLARFLGAQPVASHRRPNRQSTGSPPPACALR